MPRFVSGKCLLRHYTEKEGCAEVSFVTHSTVYCNSIGGAALHYKGGVTK